MLVELTINTDLSVSGTQLCQTQNINYYRTGHQIVISKPASEDKENSAIQSF